MPSNAIYYYYGEVKTQYTEYIDITPDSVPEISDNII